MSGLEIPSTPFSAGAAKKLAKILTELFTLLPEQSKHFMKTSEAGKNIPIMLSINAVDWAGEKSLRELLDNSWAKENSENTEESIATLQNTISYGLPALLSPLYSLFAPRSIMLGAIERGAYQPGAIAQINNNIPRETAIALIKRAKQQNENLNTMPDVLNYLRRTKVSYWSAIQFRHIIDINEIVKN